MLSASEAEVRGQTGHRDTVPTLPEPGGGGASVEGKPQGIAYCPAQTPALGGRGAGEPPPKSVGKQPFTLPEGREVATEEPESDQSA